MDNTTASAEGDAVPTLPPVLSLPVLIVDDDAPTRALYAQVLTTAGIPNIRAASGAEALNRLATEPVALVLLDSSMPGMSGLEVLAALRTAPATRTLPVILVTGAPELEDRLHGLDVGANDYLTKPVAVEELVARVRTQIRQRAAWQEIINPLRRRAAAVEALSALKSDSSVEEIAEEICVAFAAEHADGGAFLLLFGSDRLAVPVAVHGPLDRLLKVGQPIATSTAALIYAVALAGPALQDHRSIALRAAPLSLRTSASAPTDVFHVLAPIARHHQVLGLLGMTVPARTSTPKSRAELLACAVDYATAAGALLGAGTEGYAVQARRRSDLERMITQREFAIHFQPIVELTTRHTVGFEALTRWDDGSPAEVPFAAAHAFGVGIECEHAAIEEAIGAARSLPADTWLSINVSPAAAIADTSLPDVLAHADRPVVIELTEHHPIEDYPQLLDAIGRIDARVAVDDAGAGYASLHHILALRPDYVKVDLGWTRGIEDDIVRQAMIRGLTHFTEAAGCELIAEGVETKEEYATLITLGVDQGQGYLFGRPAPPSELAPPPRT